MDMNQPQPQYIGPGPAPPAQRIVIEQAWRGLGVGGWLLILFLVLLLAFSLITNLGLLTMVGAMAAGQSADDRRVEEKFHSLNETGNQKVAIVSVTGAILEGDGFVKAQIDRVRKDESVKAIVLRINSPGGTITGSDYILHHLRELTKDKDIPLVVSMGSLCASGGYYVAMAAGNERTDVIYAEPTTWTGSIGVIIPHFDVSGLMKKWEVADDSISSHPLKGMGSPMRPMTEAERTIFQSLVDAGFTQFKDVIKSGRKKFKEHPEELDKIATGQVFTTQQAIDNGLVDKEGFIEAAIDRAIELASLNRDQVRVVKYEQPLGFFDILAGGRAAAQPFDLQSLLELSTPRGYYLCTSLPALAATQR